MNYKKVLLFLFALISLNQLLQCQIIADHTSIDLTEIPDEWINTAKENLHIAYGHTSHGSQLTTGMTGLVGFTGGIGGPQYSWNNGGTGGALDLHDYAMGGDCGYYPQWVNNTIVYLSDPSNSDVNVIIWSWCGQISNLTSSQLIENYINPMIQLEIDYPNVSFVYMTGHLNYGSMENTNARNQQLSDFCNANNKILFDFADIESYDPDGNYYAFANDNCDYYDGESGSILGNWGQEWQNSHVEDVDWYNCTSAHSEPINANMKAYAAWHLWARIAGWDGNPAPTPGYVQFSSQNFNVNESQSTVSVSVQRSGDSIGEASVEYSLATGSSATLGSDFNFSPGTLNWEDNENGLKSFDIEILQDTILEGDEIINLVLHNAIGVSLSTPTEATVTIQDDDHTEIEVSINSWNDDAEQLLNGQMYLSSSDLEMIYDGQDQIIGLRFNSINIPFGVNIFNSYIQFTVDEITSEETNLIIHGQNIADALPFEGFLNNVTSREYTSNLVNWSVPAWTSVGLNGDDQQTPDLSLIISEISSRSDWVFGNSMVFIITGSGKRVAESYEGAPTLSAKLHIEYSSNASIIDETEVEFGLKTFSLTSNYPNPFNPLTKISYYMNEAGIVKISVYNTKGVLVKEYQELNRSRGSHSLNFDGSKLNSGVYYYSMTINGITETRKMILMK